MVGKVRYGRESHATRASHAAKDRTGGARTASRSYPASSAATRGAGEPAAIRNTRDPSASNAIRRTGSARNKGAGPAGFHTAPGYAAGSGGKPPGPAGELHLVPGAATPDILNRAPDLSGPSSSGQDVFPGMRHVPGHGGRAAREQSDRLAEPRERPRQNEGPQQHIAIPRRVCRRALGNLVRGIPRLHRRGRLQPAIVPATMTGGTANSPRSTCRGTTQSATSSGCRERQARPTGCCPKPNGSMSRAAARKSANSTPFWFGSEISRARANYDWRYAYLGSPKAPARRRTVPIDAAEPNPFGLLHVHGNVSEWVEDCWNETLAGMPRDCTGADSGRLQPARGARRLLERRAEGRPLGQARVGSRDRTPRPDRFPRRPGT